MISLFGNAPYNVSSEAVQTQLPTKAQATAVSKVPASLPEQPPKHGSKWFSFARAKKRLQMVESVSLGEKRFVALVQVDGRQFLIGGAPSNVGMLAELAPEETFHQVLKEATQGLDIPGVPVAPPTAAPLSIASEVFTMQPASEPVQARIALPERAVTAAASSSVATSYPVAPNSPVAANSPVATNAPVATAAPGVSGPNEPVSPALCGGDIPVVPMQPIDPVEHAFELPISLSPSLLAAMEARRHALQSPEPTPIAKKEVAAVESTAARPEVVTRNFFDAAPVAKFVVEEESRPTAQEMPLLSAPKFTFQISHFLGFVAKPTSQAGGLGGTAARELQGATL